ncbi:class I SAM-dependent DNA methyltransferase [Granulosicoccus sp. 3-233]|uniref:class I SAM-dependent DNA methyltransferase n=1 Tax=Granulosicoccus sp. 3-233 TaxID=3417969 RepID=UPI003D34080A
MIDQETMNYYNTNAALYGNHAPDPAGDFVAYRSRFIQRLKPGSRILDLGCGGGHASQAFLENSHDVVALDGSVELAKIAAQRINRDVIVKDFSDLDYRSEFDGVWAAASLTHVSLDCLQDVLERVCRALQPQGLLCASFKCAETDWRDTEGRFYSAIRSDTLSQFARQAGLQVESIEVSEGLSYLGTPASWAWLFAYRRDDTVSPQVNRGDPGIL